VLLAALSTGHKVGLALVGAAFIVFALVSAFLIPAFRPDYPTRRGLPVFLTLTAALFVGMMFAVFFFGREPSEGPAEAAAATTEAQPSSPAATETATTQTTTAATTQQQTTTATATTTTTTTGLKSPQTVDVSETEFKISLPKTSLSPGSYKFDLKNDGKIGHDLTIDGPGVSNKKTPVINGGQTATLSVDLKKGTYDFFCSVPGHKQAGMDVKVTVG
jgi:uncharacterized cupredoxin-like copper-binding protein